MKTKTLVLTAIISLGMFFQGCEKEDNSTPNRSNLTSNVENKSIKNTANNKSTYPILIEIDESDSNFIDDVIDVLNEGEMVQTSYNGQGEVVYHIVQNPNPDNSPTDPIDPSRQITCALSDANCRLNVRNRWQYNVNNGICFDFGIDYHNDMIWICDTPC